MPSLSPSTCPCTRFARLRSKLCKLLLPDKT
jgi:hypothetical protein